mmetsp:Transcript_78031/g.171063  ORF Transcript_78031/g.171063 Transcript_78031/m.171063 type:complete len:82 (+) Transcript_78031:646-891(+)
MRSGLKMQTAVRNTSTVQRKTMSGTKISVPPILSSWTERKFRGVWLAVVEVADADDAAAAVAARIAEDDEEEEGSCEKAGL